MRSFLVFALVGSLVWLVGCGGGGTPVGVTKVTVSLTPSSAQTIKAGATLPIVATVANDPTGSGVSWSLSSNFSLLNETTSSATYSAPSSLTSNQTVTVTATSIADTSVTASLQITVEPNSVTLSPAALVALSEGQTQDVKATVNTSSNQSVTWTLSGEGTLTPSATSNPVTYNAPSTVTANFTAKLTATAAASPKTPVTLDISVYASGQQNMATIVVDGGLESETQTIYPNGGFATVTVCAPGASNCSTIDHVLVDTGSFGLRLLTSAAGGELAVSLPQETSGGNPLSNCISFVDGSYLWGNVATADIQVGGEVGRNVPIQMVQDPPTGPSGIPSSCSGTGTDDDNLDGLLANGILGIGPEPTDCTLDGTNYCATDLEPIYYTCPGGTCGEVTVPANQQVTNPIVLLPADNNGSVYELPSLASGQASAATGAVIFGIGTESNNALGKATVYTMSGLAFTTKFSGQSMTNSFIDSGSNAYFFPSTFNVCTDYTSFYCDSQTTSAVNIGANNAQGTVDFTIENADTLFASSDAAYQYLGGPNGDTYPCNGSNCSFDWGLSFFFDRSVFTSIDGQTVSGEPAPPWWAY